MKFGVFKSVGHNIADSAACGLGFMIGLYTMDVFGEAAESPEGYIEVDFLTGATSGGTPTASLSRAFKLYSEEALPRLCSQHGVSVADFKELRARFWQDSRQHFEVTVEDQEGRRDVSKYEGLPGRRA